MSERIEREAARVLCRGIAELVGGVPVGDLVQDECRNERDDHYDDLDDLREHCVGHASSPICLSSSSMVAESSSHSASLAVMRALSSLYSVMAASKRSWSA